MPDTKLISQDSENKPTFEISNSGGRQCNGEGQLVEWWKANYTQGTFANGHEPPHTLMRPGRKL